MTTAIQRRRGSTVEHSTFTGLLGELTVDTTKKTVVVHDGTTAGGFPLAKEGSTNAVHVINTPAGSIIATNVQAALNELDSEKAKAGANTDITSINGTPMPTNKTLLVTADIGVTVQPYGVPPRNIIINGNFQVNQRAYVSGGAVGTNLYGHDRWKMAASADTYTFNTVNNVTTVTIPAGKVLRQVIEGLNLQSGTYTLSWEGTAQGKIGAGSYGASGIVGVVTGGTDTTLEFGPGTVSKVQFEFGSLRSPFEFRHYSVELALCQRYFYKLTGSVYGAMYAGAGLIHKVFFPVTMRAIPTVTKSSSDGTLNSENVWTATWSGYYTGSNIGTLTAFTASAEL